MMTKKICVICENLWELISHANFENNADIILTTTDFHR